MRSCASAHPDVNEFTARRRALRRYARSLQGGRDSAPLHLQVVYRILEDGSDQSRVSLTRIRAQHEVLNMCFQGTNTDLVRLPSSGKYAHKSVAGSPNLVFLPQDHTQLTEAYIERISIPSGTSFGPPSPLSALLAYLDSRTDVVSIHPNVLNLFVANLEGGILGEAYLNSNVCVCLSTSVGGFSAPAQLTTYNQGKTAVHEVGHAFGIPHPWNGTSGCATQMFGDIPRQKYPNFTAVLYTSNGVPDGALDNRYRDCKYYREGDSSVLSPGLSPPYSCLPCDSKTTNCTECLDQLHEQFMNFMDYSPDQYLVMWSQEQSQYMRDWLQSGQTSLRVLNADEVSAASTEMVGPVPETSTPGSALPASSNYNMSIQTTVSVFVLLVACSVLVPWMIHRYWGVGRRSQGRGRGLV